KLSVFADKESLMVIIRNLLDNAIKFSPKDGKIEIKSSIVGNKLRLDVIDNGSGIDADRLNEILSKEFISSTQGTASEKGSGLGLNIVKNLIKKINGEFNVESTVGKGSMFSVLIPT
ncbi:MAG TPA: ATP-binding protein, partial [Saprospiraceae bacterium]|nr:ATP-binding protein [Saprospiraceae bacterium]